MAITSDNPYSSGTPQTVDGQSDSSAINNHLSVKIPPFWNNTPHLRSIAIDAQCTGKITVHTNKFSHLVGAVALEI